MSSIGKNIKFLRTRSKMTQDALAEILCVTRQTVSNYETGKSQPDIHTLKRIADIFHVDLYELLYEPADYTIMRRHIAVLALKFLFAAVLGWLLRLCTQYASTLNQGQAQALNIFLQLMLQPAYFFLLGWLAVSSIRSLYITALLPCAIRRWILAVVIICSLLVIFALLPYYSVMLSALGIPYFRFSPLWMQLTRWITQHSRFIWISVLLGSVSGACVPKKAKIF